MRIALDLENVLADILEEEDFEQWGFDSDRVFSHFMDVSHDAWAVNWEHIEPTEPNLSETVDRIRSLGYTVDLVTNRDGVDDQIQMWLDKYDISVNAFRSNPAGTRKSELDYDVYIDDNPLMAGEAQMLYIYDQPWNQHVRGSGQYIYHSYEPGYIESEDIPTGQFESDAPWVVRVTSLRDVLYDVTGQ